MKILHTITGLGVMSGGTSTCVYELVKALNQNGLSTDILTNVGSTKNPLISNDNFIHTVNAKYRTPFSFSSTMRKALREINDYDIIHINGLWSEQSLYSAHIAKKRGIPYIVSPHGMLYPQALSVKPFRKWLMRKFLFDRMLSCAACIHATCEEEKEHYQSLGFTNEVRVIPNILQLPDYLKDIPHDRQKKRIGFLGRLHPIKNLPALLEAWRLLGAKTDEAELLIIGSGDNEYEGKLRNIAKKCPFDNIRFCGFVNGIDKFRLLGSLSALCIPSHQENFGMTAIEAMAIGTPVIASKTTPWKDLEIYHSGWWVDNSPESLSNAIRMALCLNDKEFEIMGRNGQLLVEKKYSPDVVVKMAINMYMTVLDRSCKSR